MMPVNAPWRLPLILIFLTAMLVRGIELYKAPLWYDEIYTMMMCSGHCVTMPTRVIAQPQLGDYVSSDELVPAQSLKRFSRFTAPPLETFGLVVRAAQLADLHPPLFTLLASGWSRLFGLTGPSLRWFSVLLSMLTLPFIYLLGRRLSGRKAAFLAVLFFALNPLNIHYAVEARGYSLMILLAAIFSWLILRCHDKGAPIQRLLALTVTAVAGLFTHYFFLGFLSGGWLWLFFNPGKCSRKALFLHGALVALPVLLWYVPMVPNILRNDASGPGNFFHATMPWWCELYNPSRVFFWQTGIRDSLFPLGRQLLEFALILLLTPLWAIVWTNYSPFPRYATGFGFLLIPLMALATAPLLAELIATVAQPPLATPLLLLPIALTIASTILLYAQILLKNSTVQRTAHPPLTLLYLTALLSPAVAISTDIILKVRLLTQVRYCLPALVPALLLLSLAISKLPKTRRLLICSALISIWLLMFAFELGSEQRFQLNYQILGNQIKQKNINYPVINHDHPIIGLCLARYLEDERLITNWFDGDPDIPATKPRAPRDLSTIISLINNRPGVIFIHWHAPLPYDARVAPVEAWLLEHTKLQSSIETKGARLMTFIPLNGPLFKLK